ncbi:hypothetical protein [Amycolatopsis sp. NBC_01480]|uniref:hypothetical protein n=1 Tax=Amycolatopsis sp. NBC_01480 TaxID=2903562 RepID=UPI002E2E0B50|nr:hypothetical protein [Amycolatopsis sp. NBC_01480]
MSPQPSSALPLIVVAHDGQALDLEEAAAVAASSPINETLKQVLAWAHVEWIRRFGKPRVEQDGTEFRKYVTELADRLSLMNIGGDATNTILRFARQARQLGISQGFAEAGAIPTDVSDALDTDTHLRVARAVTTARSKTSMASALVGTLQRGSFVTVNRAISPAQQAANIVHRTARTVVNEELNNALASVNDEVGGRLLWVAERDACVQCLALSGHFAVNGVFDWRLSFGKAYQPVGPDGNETVLNGPPRHMNCRCRVTPWLGHDTAAAQAVTHDWQGAIADAQANGDQVAVAAAHEAAQAAMVSASTDLPTVLRREAERSILNGYALPSESEAVRREAADRLLTRIGMQRNAPSPSGWLVPASVKRKTERALKKRTFTTRPVPG